MTKGELIRFGMIENARRGNYNSGIAPFGYEIVLNEDNKKQLIINNKEAEAVMIIFKRAVRGVEPYFISYELKQRGFKTREGNDFNARALRRILTSERYIGVFHFAGATIYDGCPAIVPMELFQAVSKTKRYRSDNQKQPSNRGCGYG